MPRPSNGLLVRVGIAVAVIAILPWVVPSFLVFDLIYVAAYAIAILGLIILTGMNGQISLGHGAFMALGGYVVAVLAHSAGVPYWLGVPLAALASGVVGLLIGLVALRLEGVYLALATFSLAVATPSFLKHYKSITGGFGGMSLEPVKAPPGVPLDGQHWLYYVAWAVTGVVFLLSALLVRGQFGRALRALRDNPIAAVSFGVNPYFYKTAAFGWSAVLAGIAGGFYAIPTAFVSPDTFTSALSITLLIGAVLGGISTFWGALIGGIVVEFLPLVAQQVNAAAPSVVYGVALILVMMFLPDGIVGGVLRLIYWFRYGATGPTQLALPLAIAGFFAGGIVGYILRPSVLLGGQLPFGIVITRGATLTGLDQLLRSTAEFSFNQMIAAAVLGAFVGYVVGFLKTRSAPHG